MLPTDALPAGPRLAYISFDTVPAPKGASTHIAAFTRALARAFGSVELVTVGAGSACQTRTERWPGVFHTELPALGVSLIDRVLCFRRCLERWLAGRQFDLIHYRSIFEGLPLLRLRPAPRLIFEVNGLPSVELKYRYPQAADDRELTRKLIAQEHACLQAADSIVTPSGVTAHYLTDHRSVERAKIRVIPNGVDTDLFRPRDEQAFVEQTSVCAGPSVPLWSLDVLWGRRFRLPTAGPLQHVAPVGTVFPRRWAWAGGSACPTWLAGTAKSGTRGPASGVRKEIPLLYFGTLAQWQGIDLAVRAVAQICTQIPARLTILGTATHRQRDSISALAAKLGIAAEIEIAPPVSQPALVQMLHRSFAVLAPLAVNDRNIVQGCCPLKVLEGMAAGIPVIASDLAVVRELAVHERHCLLVKPGSVDQLAQAVLRLHADPDLWRRLSEGGRAQVVEHYTWERSGAALVDVYGELGISPARSA